MTYVPIRLRQAVGFAERGCTPHPAYFLGPLAPNPMIKKGGLGYRPKRVWAAAHEPRPGRSEPALPG